MNEKTNTINNKVNTKDCKKLANVMKKLKYSIPQRYDYVKVEDYKKQLLLHCLRVQSFFNEMFVSLTGYNNIEKAFNVFRKYKTPISFYTGYAIFDKSEDKGFLYCINEVVGDIDNCVNESGIIQCKNAVNERMYNCVEMWLRSL
jgi:hypothetical protein